MAALEAQGWRAQVEQLPRGRYVRRILERRQQLAAADLLVVAKLKLALFETRLLRRLAPPIAYDFDDAVYVRTPRHIGETPDRSWLRHHKFRCTCRMGDLVIAGNDHLAAAARPFARRLEVVPTPVDLDHYPATPPADRQARTLVWIGRPENLMYLELIRPALATLARSYPEMRLRIVCSHFPRWSEVPLETVVWSEDREIEALTTAGIGLMPLTDDEWARGKCAFKLLQYMAASLPCVASAVGANKDVVVDGTTGYLAPTAKDWTRPLRLLLEQPDKQQVYGRAGRERVARLYDNVEVGARLAGLLRSLVA